MSVSEVIHGDGTWDLTLKPSAPASVRERLRDWYSIIRVFDAPVGEYDVSTLTPLFSGVLLRSNPRTLELGGAGPNWFLGSSGTAGDKRGPIWDNVTGPITFTNGTLTQWVTAVANHCGLGVGTLSATAATFTGSLQYVTAREVVDTWLPAGFDLPLEFRVGSLLRLAVGEKSDLYKTPSAGNMTAVVVDGETCTTLAAPSPLNAPELDTSYSVEDQIRRVVLKGASSTSGTSVAGWPYKNPAGGTLERTLYTVNQDVAAGAMSGALNRLLNANKSILTAVDLRIVGAPPFPFICGDWIWAYAPEKGLFSVATDSIDLAGGTIYPVAMRVTARTWTFHEGMSIFLDNEHQAGAGAVTELTPYVEWENGDTSVTVGALPKRLGYLPRPAS